MSDDEDTVELLPDEYFDPPPASPHPRLEDMIAQRAYIGSIIIGGLADIDDEQLRASGLDLLNAVIRSIAPEAAKVSRVK